jgi:hypothetical protein|tara:strand:- start:98 stop:280 length:183 start_codon:yes stop_codon:yes gene_type:complete
MVDQVEDELAMVQVVLELQIKVLLVELKLLQQEVQEAVVLLQQVLQEELEVILERLVVLV